MKTVEGMVFHVPVSPWMATWFGASLFGMTGFMNAVSFDRAVFDRNDQHVGDWVRGPRRVPRPGATTPALDDEDNP